MKNGAIRFGLAEGRTTNACGPNDLLELHLRELLDLLIPTQSGREIKVDGYKPLNDRHAIHHL